MEFNTYQFKTKNTWISNDKDLERIVLGVCGETGEIAEKFKKYFRGDTNDNFKKDVEKEIGDCLYYLAMLCNRLNIDMDTCADGNLKKLNKRKKEGKIKGSGDNR